MNGNQIIIFEGTYSIRQIHCQRLSNQKPW